MAKPGKHRIARAVLELHPRTQAEELGIDVGRNTPAPLYQWLIVSLLYSARIAAAQAEKAARALFEQGWQTPQAMADTPWHERVQVLNRPGYARDDERPARATGHAQDTNGKAPRRERR